MSEQPDIDHVTYVSPADYDRINAALDEPPEPNERTRAAAEQMATEQRGYTSWAEVRPRVVTSEQRVAEARAEMEQAVQPSTKQPDPAHPTGYTIAVYLPPEASEADVDAIMTRVADAVHGHEYAGTWDPFVVGHAGDWLYIDHHPDQLPDYAAHVRERWEQAGQEPGDGAAVTR